MIQDEKSLGWPGQFRLWKRCLEGEWRLSLRGVPVMTWVQSPQEGVPSPEKLSHRPWSPQRSTLWGEVYPFSGHISHSTSSPPRAGWGLGPGAYRAATDPAGAGCHCLRAAHGCLPHKALLLPLQLLKPRCFTPNSLHKKKKNNKKGRWVVTGSCNGLCCSVHRVVPSLVQPWPAGAPPGSCGSLGARAGWQFSPQYMVHVLPYRFWGWT